MRIRNIFLFYVFRCFKIKIFTKYNIKRLKIFHYKDYNKKQYKNKNDH